MCRANPFPEPAGRIANLVVVPIKAVPTSCTLPSPPTAQTMSIPSSEDF